jgi:ubiquinone/menaquinone biosynthesis C-methylase UbiE
MTSCYYCDKIVASEPRYVCMPAIYDLGSAAPRCARHWRYICGNCHAPAHFMASAYCSDARAFFCATCATGREEVVSPFWGWQYYFAYRSPWSGHWFTALDRLEFEGKHPLQQASAPADTQAVISQEASLVRYPVRPVQWRVQQAFTDDDVRANWNTNAIRWDATYDDDGDPNRRYQSDEPMLALLGEVRGLRILDVGSGNGYLCRKLAKAGAMLTGVELSEQFLQLAKARETTEPLGITYYHASVVDMAFLPEAHFDRAVSNYVLMDVLDYTAAVRQVFRVLRPGGCFVVVISHPCFACGPGDWVKPAPDSPRREDRVAYCVDNYFQRGPYLGQWGKLDPVLSFHRPLRDYWQTFTEAGFRVEGFDEPSITERGHRELPPSRAVQSLRIPYSCIFRLVKPLVP